MFIRTPLSSLSVLAVIGTLLVGGCSGDDALVRPETPPAGDCKAAPRTSEILLVHGAFADASSWSRVIRTLQGDGFTVHAVQLREQSLADDAASVRRAIDGVGGPLVVVGHSYGGVVISEASAGAANVAALVYVAAFAPAPGESIAGLSAGYAPSPAFGYLDVDAQGFARIKPDGFVAHFASDIPEQDARALAVVQVATAASILGEPTKAAAWQTIPSYYQVAANDGVINPDLQRFFAARMKATTIELVSSHASLVSRPREVSDLIERAAGVTPGQCP